MKKNLLKMFAVLLLMAASLANLAAQSPLSMPAAFDLSTGNYSLTAWADTEPALTYPANMVFQTTLLTNSTDPTLPTPMTHNYNKVYNLTSGVRVNGLGADGFRFINTGWNATSNPYLLGSAVLALNTTGRNTIKVSWQSKIILQGDRLYGLRLQYAIGTTEIPENSTEDLDFIDVVDANGNPIEVLADRYHENGLGLTGAVWNFPNVELPAALEDKPLVYLRWKYYHVSGAGSRPSISLDNIAVTSESSVGIPTKLMITQVTPQAPSSNFPFEITVRTTDNNNIPKFVSTPTTVTLAKTVGTGTLLGNTTVVIPAGQHTATFTDLRYNMPESLMVSVSATGLTSDTKLINLIPGPANIVLSGFVNKTHKNYLLPTFNVNAVDNDGAIFVDYSGQNATITATGPGNIVGTTVKTFFAGVATFDDITFDTPGTYNLTISAPGFLNPITASVLVADEIVTNPIHIPEYVKGGAGALTDDPYNNRFPNFALVELTNLLPNTTYRYLSGATDNATYAFLTPANNGAGNNIHFNANTGQYNYNSFRNFTSTFFDYSSFTTGPTETSKKVWVNIVPTTNAAFNAGKNIFWLVGVAFEDGRFITRYMSGTSSKVIDYGSDAASATGIYDNNSWLEPNTYLAFFEETMNDAINPVPVATAVVQSIGAKLQTPPLQVPPYTVYSPQTPKYFADLEEVNSAWAGYLPNDLPSGVRRIEQYDVNGNQLRTWTDTDGGWATVNTVNPTGGKVNPISFQTPQISLISPMTNEELCNHEGYYITWNSHGVENVDIEISYNGGTTWDVLFDNIPARKGEFVWDIPRHFYSERPFALRVASSEHSYINAVSFNNIIWDTPIQVSITSSEILCQTENILLSMVADGSDLKYQWYKDGKIITGATSNTYQLSNVKYQTSGTYQCVVIGKAVCPVLYSKVIEIYVATPTAISKQPNAQNVIAGGVAKFYAEAHIENQRATEKISIQWYKGTTALVDNDRIAGSRSNLLTINGVTATDESDEYYVVFTGLCPNSTVESRKVSLRLVDLMFALEPMAVTSCEGTDVSFEAEAITSTTGVITYQWYKGSVPLTDGARISGAQTEKLNITGINPADAAQYRVMASIESLGLKVWSTFADLTVDMAPVVTLQPDANIIVEQGKELNIEFDVQSGTAVTYKWFKDGVEIAGATSKTYYTRMAAAADQGEYYCVATNDCGEVTSNVAYVTVTVKSFTSVNDEVVPGMFALMPINPNPVSGNATISFAAPAASENVRLTVIDALGNEIATIFSGQAEYGLNTVSFDASNLNSGVYFISLKSNKSIATQRLVVVR